MSTPISNELVRLVQFVQATGDTVVVSLADGPVALVPLEKYQSLVLGENTVSTSSSANQVKNTPKTAPISRARRQINEEFLVEPLE
jgi:hypothetical protein